MTEKLTARIEEGKRVARERFAALPLAEQERVTAMVEGIPELLTRCFVGPDTGHGRQKLFVATPAELAEWKAGK